MDKVLVFSLTSFVEAFTSRFQNPQKISGVEKKGVSTIHTPIWLSTKMDVHNPHSNIDVHKKGGSQSTSNMDVHKKGCPRNWWKYLSVLPSATTGKFTFAASEVAWWSKAGSTASKSLGSRNFVVIS